MLSCLDLERLIKRHGYKIWSRDYTNPDVCIIDFHHPDIKIEPPFRYFLSSVVYNKDKDFLRTTVRSKVNGFKELYLDYCCENIDGECTQVCRPHVHMGEKTVSVEATFRTNPDRKFDRLLEELK